MTKTLRKFAQYGVCFALSALATQTALAENLSGKWYGTYKCEQGITAVTLSISQDLSRSGENALVADFSFYAHPENPYVPSGSYTMRGSFNAATNEMLLKGEEWDFQPYGYEMVDLDGTFKKGGSADILEGEVYFGSPNVRFGCTSFRVERILADQALF